MTYKVKIDIEAPASETDKSSYARSVFSVSLNSEMDLSRLQWEVNKLFTALTNTNLDYPIPEGLKTRYSKDG